MRYYLIGALSALMVVAGCGPKSEETHATAASTSSPASSSVAPTVPDVGKLESVSTTATGLGKTAGEAMAEAMKMALLQVNGAVVQTESVTAKYGLDVSLNQDSASLRANAFAELVQQKSGGVIQNLKVVSLEEPSLLPPKLYKATIEASIAKFKPSADMQKLKVVIGPVTFGQQHLAMGDRSVPSAQVAAALRQRISDALVQTGRFAVLDREFSPEIEQELDMISSGQAPSAELAKLSQAASADLVWSARVNTFAYNRHARQLRTSDRELVSYSGGWSLSQKMVNVATRQVTVSDSLRGAAPDRAATTLGASVDGDKMLADMTDEAAKAIVGSILQRTFPVMVVARDGTNVVLSQGGQSIREGARYAMAVIGKEMKDPQTGQSLGRMESPCCELVIDRVTPNLSYGHLENMRTDLDGIPEGGLQLRNELKQAVASASAAPAGASSSATKSQAAPAKAAPVKPSAAPAAAEKDDKW
ncbi:CsgG/HfaB family protein [Comamonas sp. UBA7528]|uniref:CsgG/HfaB family protein n=1 Tax=Comamonas sp. UBA7528 TaxID=1946391 RepID=UPI0025B8211D|nr:CsgG/HfaB family protein [Comamonas sp. UBA7528]